MVRQSLARILRFSAAPAPRVQVGDSVQRIRIQSTPMGSAGSQSFGGYPREEYLNTLQGRHRADVFDHLRRSDSQLKMCLKAVKDPIKSASWEVDPGDDSDDAKLDAEFIRHILFNDMDRPFSQFLSEALTFVDFGHSVFEVTHKTVLDSPAYGSYTGIQELGFRSQRTIEKWNLDPATGKLVSITQMAIGDLGRLVDIPAEFLLVFSQEKEGANFEGVSSLRPCYGNWFRKDHYQKLNAIGIEKFAVPTPLVEVPNGQNVGESFDNMVDALENYTTHESNYLMYPAGWKVELNTNTYDPQKVEVSIDNEDKRMVKAFMANFLELGQNGVGSHALSTDLSTFFMGSIDHTAAIVSDEVNSVLIPLLVKLNRGPKAVYPKLKHSGISDRAGKELAQTLQFLRDGDFVTPDDQLEVNLRKRIGLPKMDPTTARAKAPGAAGAPSGSAFSNDLNSLAERFRARRKRGGVYRG